MNSKQKNKHIYIKCSCTGHALQLEWMSEDKELWVSMWQYGKGKGIMGFKERVRWAWHILRTGNPWADEVILTPVEVEKLQKFVKKLD